ncbi:MAG: hypothetical protein HYV63_19630 [Candidatus Schekmanbacteria bacterium]|nr:hypothetical protein [Candidatus Schekmanbacteria bacterium]
MMGLSSAISGTRAQEVTGRFLTDAEYRIMAEELERNDAELDWGWAKAATGREYRPRELAFDLRPYKSVRIAMIDSVARQVYPDVEDVVEYHFEAMMKRFGLAIVADPEAPVEVELGLAVVDLSVTPTYAFVTTIPPFIELELRLRELKSGDTLLLIRHQETSSSIGAATSDWVNRLVELLD